MRALEILKNILHKQERYSGVSSMKPLIQETVEAIAELEALQEEQNKGYQALHCPSCQGGGCPVCGGSGFVFGKDIDFEAMQTPKSCDGCVYETANNGCKLYPCGLYCERFIGSIDRYEPSEPIFEWQWVALKKTTMGLTSWVNSCAWLTDEEFNALTKNTKEFTFVRLEETKRERK